VKGIPGVLAIATVFLGIVWTAVFVLGDTGILVSPPESVAREFLRTLQTRRYEQGRQHLASTLRAQTTGDDLRRLRDRLQERLGTIENVDGEKGKAPDEADGILETTAGPVRVPLRFQREYGEWRIHDLAPLRSLAGPP
jgi:hypothetical protein